MLEYLLKNYRDRVTCSVVNQLNGSVTFVRNATYLERYVLNTDKDVVVLAPDYLKDHYNIPNTKIHYIKDPEYYFTLFHNKINKIKTIPKPSIGLNSKIHETVIMNVEGLKVVNGPQGEKIQFVHTGNVIVGDNVEIGPYSVIHRGTMDSTIIDNGVKLGAFTNIAHNNIIGKNTVFAARATTNGSVIIGKQCWISSGVNIKNGVSICDNVIIGMGTNVIRSIIEPGVYVGTPARKIGEYTEDWNF